MIRRTISGVFFIIATSLWSQSPTPIYVVIDVAEGEISELEGRNVEMSRTISGLEQENLKLSDDIARSEEFISRADTMIERLSATMGELYTLLQSVVDLETRRELQRRMEENRQARYDLENRKRRELEQIAGANLKIENNRKMIAVNRVRSRANDQRIEYLRACIELSQNENLDVDNVLRDADRVRQEVEAFLNQ